MSSRYSVNVVSVVGYRVIVGCGGKYILGDAGEVTAALVESNFICRP